MCKVKDIYSYIDSFAPFESQEDWDNSGFLVGEGEKEVKKILVALDVTEPVLKEAQEIGAELVVSHHPVIFGALKELHPESTACLALKMGIAVISAHTNLDVAEGGVNDCLAEALGLKKVKKCGDELGLLRIGELEKPLSCEDFVEYTAKKLGVGGIKYTPAEKMIKTVAICGGSGAEFFPEAMKAGADAYVTANVKHNYFIDIKKAGFCVLDAGHFCTENVVVVPLTKKLAEKFKEAEVAVSKVSCDPALYWVK